MNNDSDTGFKTAIVNAGIGGVLVYAVLNFSGIQPALPLGLWLAFGLFGGLSLAAVLKGKASQPTKSYLEVERARGERDKAIEEKEKAVKEKRAMEEKMDEALEKHEEIKDRNEELEESVKKRQQNMTEEINEKAERTAYEMAEEKTEEMLKEKAEEKREELIEKDQVRRQALTPKIREEAEKEIEEEREKFRKLSEIVIEDDELLSILWDGPITEERFKVLFRASTDPKLKGEFESVQEVNGDVELWIERKAEELEEEETGEPQGEVTSKTREVEPEGEGIFEEEESPAPEETGTEKPESEQSKEELIARLKEEFSTTKKDIIRCLLRGISSSSKIAEKLGVTPQTVRNHYSGLKEHGLITTGATGAGLTDFGRRFGEALK